jgi:tRNA threonylcarbamoyladenosine biosynthesis protein TsaE
VHIRTHSAEETEALGRELSRVRPDARELAVVYLTGELGAGKTTFARGFLEELGVRGAVRSPTYTLLELYERDTVTVLHIDLYRLAHPAELEPLGLREWARPETLWLIEWPERGEGRLPASDLTLTFTLDAPAHEIALKGDSEAGKAWLKRLDSAGRRGARASVPSAG